MAHDAAYLTASFFCGSREGIARFTLLEPMGHGSYGIVYSAVDNRTGDKVAIKRIGDVFNNTGDAKRILREIKLLRLLDHPNIIAVRHIILPENPRSFNVLFVVFDLMDSDLHTVIRANDDLTHDHHRVFKYQMLHGMAYLHTVGVAHRDVKPKNILANSDCVLRICDLGLARPCFLNGQAPAYLTEYVATRWYRAPELCGQFYGTYTQAVDVWALGCIVAEVLLGTALFPGANAPDQLNRITDLVGKPEPHVIDAISNDAARAYLHAMPPKPAQDFTHIFPNADPLGLDLLRRMLAFDPKQRPSAAEALSHPYFDGFPRVDLSHCLPVPQEQFVFENFHLQIEHVRKLIFEEALHYHPAMMTVYIDNNHVMPHLMAQLEPHALNANANPPHQHQQQGLLPDQPAGPLGEVYDTAGVQQQQQQAPLPDQSADMAVNALGQPPQTDLGGVGGSANTVQRQSHALNQAAEDMAVSPAMSLSPMLDMAGASGSANKAASPVMLSDQGGVSGSATVQHHIPQAGHGLMVGPGLMADLGLMEEQEEVEQAERGYDGRQAWGSPVSQLADMDMAGSLPLLSLLEADNGMDSGSDSPHLPHTQSPVLDQTGGMVASSASGDMVVSSASGGAAAASAMDTGGLVAVGAASACAANAATAAAYAPSPAAADQSEGVALSPAAAAAYHVTAHAPVAAIAASAAAAAACATVAATAAIAPAAPAGAIAVTATAAIAPAAPAGAIAVTATAAIAPAAPAVALAVAATSAIAPAAPAVAIAVAVAAAAAAGADGDLVGSAGRSSPARPSTGRSSPCSVDGEDTAAAACWSHAAEVAAC